MKKSLKILAFTLALISIGWTALTLWVEQEGAAKDVELGNSENGKTALIVYDPDPFYNLDQQVCEAFGQSLADDGWKVHVATVAAAKKLRTTSVNLYVFCANTYNWSPDWALSNFIKSDTLINSKNVVAITLGAGTTGRSQRLLESYIKSKNGNLIASNSFYLWRPNDEALAQESNVALAINLTKQWADEIAKKEMIKSK
jgi:hypothetical protein